MKILFADDNKDTAYTTARLMEMGGHDVREAHNGKEALEICLSWKPDIAVLDISMPQMTGLEVAVLVRAKKLNIRLIALTAWTQPAMKKRIEDAGFEMMLTKPIDATRLKLAIERGILSGGKR